MLGLLQLRPPIRPLTLPAASRSIVETLLLGANANRAPVAGLSRHTCKGECLQP
jgi:hypothetical protein